MVLIVMHTKILYQLYIPNGEKVCLYFVDAVS